MKPRGELYLGGFSLTQTPDELKAVILNTRDLFVRTFNNDTEAYVFLVCEHVRRNTAANTVPVIPSLEDWRRFPFFLSPNMDISPVPAGRVFLLINMEFAGIYDNLELLVNDCFFDESLFIVEVRNELDAVNYINDFYQNRVFRVLPYINSKVPFISGAVTRNVLHRMPYTKILEAVVTPEEIKMLNPLNSGLSNTLDYTCSPGKDTELKQIAEILY